MLAYDVLRRTYEYCQLDVSGEYYLISVVTQAAVEGAPVVAVPVTGEYLDCGNVHGWLWANQLIVNRQAA